MSQTSKLDIAINTDDRRLWIGNLDTRITEFQLLKIAQKCGHIEKFDVIFHKSGPQVGLPRGYAFVTYKDNAGAMMALQKLHGKLIGTKNVVVRLAKNINYDDVDKPKAKVEIPALAAGASSTSKMSKALTIKAIEAKLKALENRADDFVINKTNEREVPLIHKYQYNKNSLERGTGTGYGSSAGSSQMNKYGSKGRYSNGPYNKHQRRHKR